MVNAPAAQAADTGIRVWGLVVNDGGKPIVVGVSGEVLPPMSFNVTLPAGYSTADPASYAAYPFLYRGDPKKEATYGDNYIGPGGYTCYQQSAREERCEGELYIVAGRYPQGIDSNADATVWKVGVYLHLLNANGTFKAEEFETRALTVRLKRAVKLSVGAAPGKVAKGGKVTVTGELTRANWNTTVKTVKSSSTGALKTTVTASADGHYRWVYAGDSATGAVNSAGGYVDVR